ncbi:hypothetical protein [Rufibacter latericius]|uniref:DUF2807 domain-containing protein n=1 Tax=Rufibacter latericius TaxID=2487040 RepID=A0A3M9MUW7_9BACT|nr:hypothetical protein [Rufibacter latericius]RNI28693.1 hypothetical protein EFB08_08645 [Rufibacter latericius]
MKAIYVTLVALLGMMSCAGLNSTTYIQPNNSFVLGNNEHGGFKVNLQNASNTNLSIHQAPVNGGKHSTLNVKPNQRASLKVDKNTAVVISNASNDTAAVNLKVTGDLGLSMGYKKQ